MTPLESTQAGYSFIFLIVALNSFIPICIATQKLMHVWKHSS
jgi:hypothetical protein